MIRPILTDLPFSKRTTEARGPARQWRLLVLALLGFAGLTGWSASAPSDAPPVPVVIIKADDFKEPTSAWDRFLEVSRHAGVKVSMGVIVEAVRRKKSTIDWMRAQESRGDVEFWDHGWDHKSWKEAGQKISEFRGSGLAHQREHLAQAQTLLKDCLGHESGTLGTPFNGFDTNTAVAINEHSELRVFFAHNPRAVGKLLKPAVTVIEIYSESDGTAKPNAAKFAAWWQARSHSSECVALQFHPPGFDAAHLKEYEAILELLKQQSVPVRLPSEVSARPAAVPVSSS